MKSSKEILFVTKLQIKIADRLREWRTERGWSQDTAAELLKMHRTYYSAIERGEKNLTLSTILRICDLYDKLPHQLLQ